MQNNYPHSIHYKKKTIPDLIPVIIVSLLFVALITTLVIISN